MNKLDVLLVNPSSQKQVYGKLSDSLAACEPPVWTALLAAFIREKGYSVAIMDADAESFQAVSTLGYAAVSLNVQLYG